MHNGITVRNVIKADVSACSGKFLGKEWLFTSFCFWAKKENDSPFCLTCYSETAGEIVTNKAMTKSVPFDINGREA